tara:strand:- start:259 stop:1377 length:1119 start_codon:yes stop_codon:yes gene_type:complete
MSKKAVIFGHTMSDTRLLSRVSDLKDIGYDCVLLSYSRRDWPEVYDHGFRVKSLGFVGQGSLFRRIAVMMVSVLRVFCFSFNHGRADYVHARNLDLLILARLFCVFSRSNEMVYEVADLHPSMTGEDLRSRFLRCVERVLLSKCACVLITSPGFKRGYFDKYHPQFSSKCRLVENRLPVQIFERPISIVSSDSSVLNIGYWGAIRCAVSLRLLLDVAKRNECRICIHIWGHLSTAEVRQFEKEIKSLRNVYYYGKYSYPLGLEGFRGIIDISWCCDFYDETNSILLLPNRLYESLYLGLPVIVFEGSETCSHATELTSPIALKSATVEGLESIILGLKATDITEMKQRSLCVPDKYLIGNRQFRLLVQEAIA